MGRKVGRERRFPAIHPRRVAAFSGSAGMLPPIDVAMDAAPKKKRVYKVILLDLKADVR